MVLEFKTKLQDWECSKSAQSSQTAVLGYFLVDLTFFSAWVSPKVSFLGSSRLLAPRFLLLWEVFRQTLCWRSERSLFPHGFVFYPALKGSGKDEGSQLWV